MLEVEPVEPGLPFASAKFRPCCVGERREVLGVRPPGGGEAAALGKTLERVVTHRVEQVVARTFGGERHREDRLVDEHAEEVRDRRLVEPFARTDGVERRQRRAAAVHRDLVEQRLLVRVQEVVAPLHERPERGAARVRRRPVAKQPEAALDD